MSNLIGVAGDAAALQLRLAGVEVVDAVTPAEAERHLSMLLDTETRVIVVEKRLTQGFSTGMKERLAGHKGLPLVVFCPAFEGDEAETDAYIASVLKPAIGYEIRLE